MKKIKLLTAICMMASFTAIRANDFDKGGDHLRHHIADNPEGR